MATASFWGIIVPFKVFSRATTAVGALERNLVVRIMTVGKDKLTSEYHFLEQHFVGRQLM